MSPRQVLVCGSNYGRAYIRALRRRPDAYQFAGLLARGSERSLRLAEECHVPFYAGPALVPTGIDLACVALGSAAFDVVLTLVERGVPVLLEHPVPGWQVEAAAAAAREHQTPVHVQTLFPAFDAPRRFISASRERGLPLYLEVQVTDRALYAALDIVRQAFGPLAPDLSRGPSTGPFDSLTGSLSGAPALLHVQRFRTSGGRLLDDGDPGYLVDCRMSAWWSEGILSLLSVAGPVVWTRPLRGGLDPVAPMWEGAERPAPRPADLREAQTQCNLEAIEALAAHAAGGPAPAVQQLDHQLDVARSWEHVTRALAPGGTTATTTER
jgi:thiazolinyl imide reductase